MSDDNKVQERLKRMTREQKIEEFNSYAAAATVMKIDLHEPSVNAAAAATSDEDLDRALLRIAQVAGGVFGTRPMTAGELHKALEMVRENRIRQHDARQPAAIHAASAADHISHRLTRRSELERRAHDKPK